MVFFACGTAVRTYAQGHVFDNMCTVDRDRVAVVGAMRAVRPVTLLVARDVRGLTLYRRFHRTFRALRVHGVHLQSPDVYVLYATDAVVRCHDSYTCRRRPA